MALQYIAPKRQQKLRIRRSAQVTQWGQEPSPSGAIHTAAIRLLTPSASPAQKPRPTQTLLHPRQQALARGETKPYNSLAPPNPRGIRVKNSLPLALIASILTL